MLKMQKLNCLSFKISTQNLVLSYYLQRTISKLRQLRFTSSEKNYNITMHIHHSANDKKQHHNTIIMVITLKDK